MSCPDPPPDVPEFEWIECYAWSEGYGKACGGTVVSADERTVVYQAPAYPGLAVLEWDDGVSEPIWLAFVVPGGDTEWDQEIDLPREPFEGFDGSFLPTAGGSSFRVFAIHPCGLNLQQHPRPCGQGWVYAENMRLVPSKRPTGSCGSGDKTWVYNYKEFPLPPEEWVEQEHTFTLRGVRVTATIYGKLRVRHIQLWDCYECRNGEWKWCGNAYKTWFTYYRSHRPHHDLACAYLNQKKGDGEGCCRRTVEGGSRLSRTAGCCEGMGLAPRDPSRR